MPRKATGTAYELNGRWFARVTLGPEDRPKIELPTCKSKGAAETRRDVLADVAARLRAANVPTEAATALLRGVGAATDGKALDRAHATAEAVCKGEARPKGDPSKPITFRQLGERWTSGELARLYPDHVKRKKAHEQDRQFLTKHVYPIVGSTAITAFTMDDADRVMRALPHSEPGTRRRYGLLMRRVLQLAIFPLRLIVANPIPPGFVPRGAN